MSGKPRSSTAGAAPVDSTARELRKGIVLRLGVAIAALAGLAIAWHAFDTREPTTPAADTLKANPSPAARATATDAPHRVTDATAQSGAAAEVLPQSVLKPSPATEQKPSPATEASLRANTAPQEQSPSPALPPQAGADTGDRVHSEGMIRTLERVASLAVPKLPSGPYLQVGVFMHPANADELKAKLEAEGIPVVVATRVQVGPFKNRKEAEAMREKLSAMGMSARLVNQ